MFNVKTVVVLLCRIWIEQLVSGRGTLEVEFQTYSNPSHGDYDGGCCEPSFFGLCVNDCDNYFELCYRNYSATSGCNVHKITKTIKSNDDSFGFPTGSGVFGNGISNPVQFSFSRSWTNSFGLLVTVWDNDGGRVFDIGGSSDKIDVISFRTSNAPVTTSWRSATISGRRATINLRYRVRCDPHWYRSCDVYCKPQSNYLGYYTCSSNGNKICNIGWKGANCNQPFCRSGCHATHGYCNSPFQCLCRTGWTGYNCDQCIKKSGCVNGYCINGNECRCNKDWSGSLCDTDLNQCRSSPCKNGGTCINSPNTYACKCLPGYIGKNCETENDACDGSPCKNGATCVNKRIDYDCKCLPGYNGKDCDHNINECAANPCINGKCIDGINSYTCQCLTGMCYLLT